MFARDDVDRGWRWPLLWIVLPLLLGALIVTGLGILARASQGFPDIELADRLRIEAESGDPLLADVTDFAWDRVCVFPPYLPSEAVDDTLGLEWGVVGGDTIDTRLLLVFVRGDEVVRHLYLDRGIVREPAAEGDCRDPADEATRLSRSGSRATARS